MRAQVHPIGICNKPKKNLSYKIVQTKENFRTGIGRCTGKSDGNRCCFCTTTLKLITGIRYYSTTVEEDAPIFFITKGRFIDRNSIKCLQQMRRK